jgi:hypothetical protein
MERARMNPNRFLPAACAGAVTAWLAALAIRLPPRDGDLLWQQWLGDRILREHAIPRALGPEAFAAGGAPWTPHEWLFSVALAWTSDRGLPWAVPLACALAAGCALATVALRCRRRGVPATPTAAAVLICALAMLQSFGPRAQVVGWAGLAALLWLLELDGPAAWLAAPLTLVWANLHASVFLAPLLAAAYRRYALAVACALMTLLTPFGFGLVRYTLGLLTSPIRHSISEWAATSMHSAAFVLGALPLLVLLAAHGVRASSRDRLVACAFVVILFTAVRNVPVFALVTAPIAFASVPTRRDRPAARTSPGFAGWSATAAVAAAGIALAALAWQRAPTIAGALPSAQALALLQSATTPPRVFCEDFAWCSLFLGTEATVLIDGRADPYPPRIWREYRDVIDGKPDWEAILDRRRIDAILVRPRSALDSLLTESAAWRRLSGDGRARVYLRSVPVAKI